jgi:hypothetical protein
MASRIDLVGKDAGRSDGLTAVELDQDGST